MEIKIRSYSSIYIVDLSGEMDLYNSHRLKEVVHKMIDRGLVHYIINMEKLTYIDSSGVGALLYVYGIIRKAGHKLKMVGANGSVKRVIELTKLIGYLPMAKSIQEAIKEMAPAKKG